MTTYNTGNPVGSTAAKDLYDNAENLDAAVNGTAKTWTDRLGKVRMSMKGVEEAVPEAIIARNDALTARDEAQTAKTAAEAARDAANAVGKVFTTTALGIAGTTSGESFSVLSADLLDLIVYTNVAGVATELLRFKTKGFFDTIFGYGYKASRTGYLHAWVDSVGALLLGIKNDGTLWSKGANVTESIETGIAALALGNAASTAVAAVIPGPLRGDYLIPFTDSADRILGGFLANGEFESKGVNLSAAVATLVPFASAPTPIYAWGDSLTENGSYAGGWILGLGVATGRTVYNLGYGGQSAPQIIGRQGSYLTTITVTGNQIPASGPVNVTVSNAILDTSGTVATAACSLNGVAGTLSKSGAQYVFTRTAAGSVVTVWPGTTLELTPVADAAYCANIIWVGRNHFNYAQTVGQYDAQIVTVLGAIDKAVQSLNPLNRRFMVVGVTNGSTEAIGSDGYNAILSCNAQIQARYPKQYLDIRKVLLEGGTGTGQDATDYANGVIPSSLRSDTQHFNAAGNALIWPAFQAKLSYLGI